MEEKIRLAVFGQKRLSREGGIEIVVKELCTRMAQNGCEVTCYNRAGHHVSGAEYDKTIEYDGIRQKVVPTIEKKGLAAVSSSFFAALYSAFGRYDVVHIHAEGPAFFCWIPKLFGKRVVNTIHGLDWDREKWHGSVASKFIRGGEKNAVKYADEIIVLSKGVQKYFMETYGRETHFIETIKKLPKMYFTNITGGEPFIRTDLKDIVRELYKKSDRIVISTHGFFTDRIVDLCKEFPQIGIRISIEGLEQTNNEIRGLQNGYQRGYGTLKKLREMGMKDVGFGMTVQDKNAPDLVPLYKISDEMGMEFATASLHNSFYFVEAKNIIHDRPMVAKNFENHSKQFV